MMKLYGDSESGNCYKVKLVLTQLDQPFDWVEINVPARETRAPEFLAMNPNGKVPLLELEPGVYMTESNAMMYYLADGTDLMPAGRLERARVMEWLFFEQYSHEPYIAVIRYLIYYLNAEDEHREAIEQKRGPGYAALDIMEKHLSASDYLAGGRYSIADVGLYAYTHLAHQGRFDLGKYSAIHAWFERVKSQKGHVPMG